ncbi:MAG TPA: hypothetical protein VI756_32780, partial [Blastocatellia bacterium]
LVRRPLGSRLPKSAAGTGGIIESEPHDHPDSHELSVGVGHRAGQNFGDPHSAPNLPIFR